tara:strand:+ start:66 stop:839 length:774 start_codon:yes stop_codon:yes gene_type:complete
MENGGASRQRANERVQWLMSIVPGLVLFTFPIGCVLALVHAVWKLFQYRIRTPSQEELPNPQEEQNCLSYHYFGQSIYVGLLLSHYFERSIQILLAVTVAVNGNLVDLGLLAIFSSIFRCFLKDIFPQYVLGGPALPLGSSDKFKFYYTRSTACVVYFFLVAASSITIYAASTFLRKDVEGSTLLYYVYILLLSSSCVDCILSLALWTYAFNTDVRVPQAIVYASLSMRGFARIYSVRLSSDENSLTISKRSRHPVR